MTPAAGSRSAPGEQHAPASPMRRELHINPFERRKSGNVLDHALVIPFLCIDHVGGQSQRRNARAFERVLREQRAGLRQAVVGRHEHHRGVDAAALGFAAPSSCSSRAADAAPRSSSTRGWPARASAGREARECTAGPRTACTSTTRRPRRNDLRARCRSRGRATGRRRST